MSPSTSSWSFQTSSNNCHQVQVLDAKWCDYFPMPKVDVMIAEQSNRIWCPSTGMQTHTAGVTELPAPAHLSVAGQMTECFLFYCSPCPSNSAVLHFSRLLPIVCDSVETIPNPGLWQTATHQGPCRMEEPVPWFPYGHMISNIEGHLMSARKEWYQLQDSMLYSGKHIIRPRQEEAKHLCLAASPPQQQQPKHWRRGETVSEPCLKTFNLEDHNWWKFEREETKWRQGC